MYELQMEHHGTAVEKMAGSNRHRLDDAKINTQDGVTYR